MFSPETKWKEAEVNLPHTYTRTTVATAPTKHSFHRPEVTDLTDNVTHTLIMRQTHTHANTFHTLSSQASPQ